MSLEQELAELSQIYHAQKERLDYLESEVLLLGRQEERMIQLEQCLKNFSDFVGSIHSLDLTPPMRKQRAALQERAEELLEGKEKE